MITGHIKTIVEDMQRLTLQAHAEYSREIDAVFRNRSRDANQIERLPDGILGFCFNPEMLCLYKKLCRYYYDIAPAATVAYVNAYREMWDDGKSEIGAEADFARRMAGIQKAETQADITAQPVAFGVMVVEGSDD